MTVRPALGFPDDQREPDLDDNPYESPQWTTRRNIDRRPSLLVIVMRVMTILMLASLIGLCGWIWWFLSRFAR
jgi:hypothetical protein